MSSKSAYWFLKDHVTLKTGVMMLKFSFDHRNKLLFQMHYNKKAAIVIINCNISKQYCFYCIFNQINKSPGEHNILFSLNSSVYAFLLYIFFKFIIIIILNLLLLLFFFFLLLFYQSDYGNKIRWKQHFTLTLYWRYTRLHQSQLWPNG